MSHTTDTEPATDANENEETPETSCPACGAPVHQSGKGRPRVWCSDRCRRLASEARRGQRLGYLDVDVQRAVELEPGPLTDLVAANPDLLASAMRKAADWVRDRHCPWRDSQLQSVQDATAGLVCATQGRITRHQVDRTTPRRPQEEQQEQPTL